MRQRVAEDYAKHWQALGSMLARGGSWMLPDDHEFWNDYPFYDSLLPTLFMLKLKLRPNNFPTPTLLIFQTLSRKLFNTSKILMYVPKKDLSYRRIGKNVLGSIL